MSQQSVAKQGKRTHSPFKPWELNFINRWTVHSRAIDGGLSIEVNSCFTEDNALVTISVTSSLLDLLSVRSCTIHTDCPSAMCIPIRDIVKTTREERGLRTLFLVEHPHTGVCIPLYVSFNHLILLI
jgi:hypothetical protein